MEMKAGMPVHDIELGQAIPNQDIGVGVVVN